MWRRHPTMRRRTSIFAIGSLTFGIVAATLGTALADRAVTRGGTTYLCKTSPIVTSSFHSQTSSQAQRKANARLKWNQKARARYGGRWSNWAISDKRSTSCRKSLKDPGTLCWVGAASVQCAQFKCTVTGTPCRKAGLRTIPTEKCKRNRLSVNGAADSHSEDRLWGKWTRFARRKYGRAYSQKAKAIDRKYRCFWSRGQIKTRLCEVSARPCS